MDSPRKFKHHYKCLLLAASFTFAIPVSAFAKKGASATCANKYATTYKGIIEEEMTLDQITEAQKLSK